RGAPPRAIRILGLGHWRRDRGRQAQLRVARGVHALEGRDHAESKRASGADREPAQHLHLIFDAARVSLGRGLRTCRSAAVAMLTASRIERWPPARRGGLVLEFRSSWLFPPSA